MDHVLANNWDKISSVILYGYGNIGKSCFNRIKKDFAIDYIIDQDKRKQKMLIDNIPILSLDDGLNKREQQKIIVMTGERTYNEVSQKLEERGLRKYIDFCSIEFFITEWYWKYRNMNCIMELHMALTMKCSLKCKNCNMFVPYYEKDVTYDIETIKSEIDLLFQKVDYIFSFTLLGGEPLLHPDWAEVVHYLAEIYSDRVGIIKIITNGTIIPRDEVLKSISSYPVWISISDYTGQVEYQSKLQMFVEKLQHYCIDYTVNKKTEWRAFGFPDAPWSIDKKECAIHMQTCAPIFHGYNDKKIFFCHVAWSAEKCGKYKLKKTDYIDLNTIKDVNRHDIAKHCYGEIEGGYVSFCRQCGGCGPDNNNIVIAGEQNYC